MSAKRDSDRKEQGRYREKIGGAPLQRSNEKVNQFFSSPRALALRACSRASRSRNAQAPVVQAKKPSKQDDNKVNKLEAAQATCDAEFRSEKNWSKIQRFNPAAPKQPYGGFGQFFHWLGQNPVRYVSVLIFPATQLISSQ